MNADPRALYQDVILEHNRHSKHKGPQPIPPARYAEGHNPLCGDRVEVYANVDDQNTLEKVTFESTGCAICTASASMMAGAVQGRSVDEARGVWDRFRTLVTEGGEAEGLGDLHALGGVRAFPMRVKCATLAWHTLFEALEKTPEDQP